MRFSGEGKREGQKNPSWCKNTQPRPATMMESYLFLFFFLRGRKKIAFRPGRVLGSKGRKPNKGEEGVRCALIPGAAAQEVEKK